MLSVIQKLFCDVVVQGVPTFSSTLCNKHKNNQSLHAIFTIEERNKHFSEIWELSDILYMELVVMRL